MGSHILQLCAFTHRWFSLSLNHQPNFVVTVNVIGSRPSPILSCYDSGSVSFWGMLLLTCRGRILEMQSHVDAWRPSPPSAPPPSQPLDVSPQQRTTVASPDSNTLFQSLDVKNDAQLIFLEKASVRQRGNTSCGRTVTCVKSLRTVWSSVFGVKELPLTCLFRWVNMSQCQRRTVLRGKWRVLQKVQQTFKHG